MYKKYVSKILFKKCCYPFTVYMFLGIKSKLSQNAYVFLYFVKSLFTSIWHLFRYKIRKFLKLSKVLPWSYSLRVSSKSWFDIKKRLYIVWILLRWYTLMSLVSKERLTITSNIIHVNFHPLSVTLTVL